ncbi:MAG: hypothetical protein R3E82_07150 [Pseudomonadales bacterium]
MSESSGTLSCIPYLKIPTPQRLMTLGNPHTFPNLSRDEDELSPFVTVEWDATADAMLYATFRQGFKAGGFDEDDPGTYYVPVAQDWEMGIQANVNFSDKYEVPGDLDPLMAQDSFYKLNARLSLDSLDGRYQLALIGKNLNDKKTTAWDNDVPLGNLLGNNYFQFIDPPRTMALQAQVNF